MIRISSLAAFTGIFITISTRAALPAGWTDADIGSPAQAGSGSFVNGAWTVSGGGSDIWNANDQFNFTSSGLASDCALTAQILSQSSANSFAQSGVMIRASNAANGAEVSCSVTPASGVTFRYRLSAGTLTAQTLISGVSAPVWLRLIRTGNSFAASYSKDGVGWKSIGSPQIVAMSSSLAGLCVTAHDNTQLNTANFTNVSLVTGLQAAVPADLANKMNAQTMWPVPQLDVARNALTPRMGWNSWFVVGDAPGPSESVIESTADALATNGLAAAGYKIVTIDCAWIASGRGYRDANGNLVVDSTRWPDGMKAVSDYVHSKGLLMGGYSDIGANGWGNPSQIGMNGFYQQDANQFAAWQWDFIKIDDHGPGDFFSAAYAIVNNASNRPIILSLSTPQTDGLKFAPRIANSFRVHDDISFSFGSVTWNSILTQFDTAQADWYAQAPGHFLDPDMLCVGFNGISDLEGRTQFNLWSILGAPLMIGTDVRASGGNFAPALTSATLATLTNTEVIAVDQDPLCAVGFQIAPNVYAKPLNSFTSGQFAVLLLNRLTSAQDITVKWRDLGLALDNPAAVRDLWAHVDLGSFAGSFTVTNVPAHGSVMLKVTGIFDWGRPRVYETESAYNSFSGTSYYVPRNSNFSSGAYVTGIGFDATNAFQFNKVSAPSNGFYEVDIYYVSSSNRTAQLSMNGGSGTNIFFPTTGSDTGNVSAFAVYLPLLAGENALAFSNPTGPAPNFDKIVVSRGTPMSLQAVAGDGHVALSWSAPATGVTFNLYRGTDSGTETFLAGGLTTTNFIDSAVTNGANYFYVVTEVNPSLSGESPPSIEVNARPRYATTSFAFSSVVLSNSPVAFWRLNETNGTTAADAMGAFNGTYGNAVTLGSVGPRPADFLGFEMTNTAAQLTNGVSNSWITIPALNLNTNTVTIIAWIYPAGAQAPYTGLVFCRNNGTVAGMNFSSAGTDLGYTWNDNFSSWGWSSGVQPPVNQWSFVAIIVQPSLATVYLINTNGVLSASNILSHPTQAFGGAGTIGTDAYSSAARAFNGVIDEVAVFNRALTAAQIQQLYDNGHQLSQVQVAIQKSGSNLNLNWPQGTLQQSFNMIGPWSVVTNAAGSFSPALTNNSTFFRILLQQ